MELEGKRYAIELFSIVQNQVKIGFDARIITDVFQKELSKRLSKKKVIYSRVISKRGRARDNSSGAVHPNR